MTTKRFTRLQHALMNSGLLNASADATTDAHSDYVQNYIAICNYAMAASKSELPVLLRPPAYWEDYVKNLVGAKTAVQKWIERLMPSLIGLPQSLYVDEDNANKIVLDLFHHAIDTCDALIKKPSSDLKDGLCAKINNSINNMQLLILEINGLVSGLESFNNTLLIEQAEKLQKIADLVKEDEKADNDKIQRLKDAIDEMKSEIKSLTAAIVGLAVADGAALVLSVIALSTGVGAIALIFTGAAIAVATTYIVIDSMKIKDLNAKIDEKRDELDDYSKDVSALVLTSQNFTELAEQANRIKTNLQSILNVWQSLDEDLKEVNAEIESSKIPYNSEDWQGVKQDFQEATTLWNTFIDHARVCEIPAISGNTCQLKPGMSSQEIDNAVKAGTNLSLIEYLIGRMAS
jgi:FtsZ-binding cell division protein ZapB